MADAYVDEVNGTSATEHVINGTDLTVSATIDNVTGDDWGTLFSNCKAALAALSPPRTIGTACPNVSAPNFLQSIRPAVIQPGTCKVTLVYRGFPALQIEIGTVLTQQPSNLDQTGNVIFVEYQYPSSRLAINGPLADGGDGTIVIDSNGLTPQVVFVQKGVQDTTFSVKFTVVGITESSVGGADIMGATLNADTSIFDDSGAANATPPVDNGPIMTTGGFITASTIVLAFAQSFVGTVNANTWTSVPGKARTWLCESVRGISRDGGITYEVTIVFHYRADNWDFLVWFKDPYQSGTLPKDYNPSARKKVRGYNEGTLPIMPPPS